MTNEEALKLMKWTKGRTGITSEEAEAIGYAIEKLSNSDEDCISRQAVLALKTPVDTMTGWSGYMIDALDVEQLPSIQPNPKTGHWEQFGNSWEDKFKCSECGKEQPKILCGERIIGNWSDFCPNCGADMRESEDKE